MQKISPLRSSIEAFNKFRAARKAQQSEAKQNSVQTNPFGITFKGNIVQMDVFETTKTKAQDSASKSIVSEKLQNAGKLLASAWVGTINKFNSLKSNVVSFGNKVKDNTIEYAKKFYDFASKPIEFNVFKYNVNNLKNESVGNLRTMLQAELQGVV